ncbi:uncharacterized protein STEHIDRAFT_28238, partial [Stereum hirsutum FP-91666 SS1]
PPQPRPATPLSEWSSPPIPDSQFFARDFMLAASMVIIQPSTGKVVVVNDTKRQSWFLPRGRKDVGENLEQCALREAYEESGFRAEFLPVVTYSRAPHAPQSATPDSNPVDPWGIGKNTEPIYITTQRWGPKRFGNGHVDNGGIYQAFYYVGQIPADAVREENTGMPDEQTYVGTLLDLEEALKLLSPSEGRVALMAYRLWKQTLELEEEARNKD